MLSTLLATKLHRPRPTSSLVARPRLSQRLDEGLRNGHRLFLVVAPAGYGKTTLVTDWLDKTGIPSAWLSLDEADNDPLRFFTYVVAALQKTVDPNLTQPLPETFPMTPQSPEAFVFPLINDLVSDHAVDRPILLALDDYHVITAGLVQDAMVLLLRRAPPNLHLVVLTRADPPFPLPRLRVRERLTEIRDRDLRFTPEEMTAFLNSLHRLNLSAEQVTALETRTEGWAAGVQLAALSLQGHSAERAAQFISAFSGSHHYIVDYLFDEVLSRQPDAVREFLLKTSILDRMCAPLCEAILSRGAMGQGSRGDERDAVPPAREILETLERSNLFLVPLDDDRHWYRYHHLFVDVLREMLQSARQPDQIAGLHGRASDWYAQNGFVADAFHHALRAGDHERAAEIVEEHAWSMVLHAEFANLKKWTQALPADLLSRHPWLRINYAWAVMFAEPEEAEAQLAAVEQHSRAGDTCQAPLQAEMQGHIAAIRAWIACLRGDLDRAVVLSHQALELWPRMEVAVRSGLIAILGVGCRAHNDLTGAERSFAESVELAQCSGNVMFEVVGHTSLGRVSEMMGRLHEAEAIYREGLDRAILHKSPAAGQAYRFLANVYREWNDLASAMLLAEKSIEPSRMWGHANPLVEGLLTCARIHQAQNNIPEANRALAEVNEAIRGRLLEATTIQWIGAIRARLWLAQGKLDDARRWSEARGLSAEAKLDLENEVEYLTLVRLLLAKGRVDEAQRLLARLQSAAESTGRQGSLIEVLVLQAVALDMQADTDAALAVLEQALGLARPEGYMRMFLDEGKPIEALLRTAITRWRDRDLLAYARKLLAAFYQEQAERPVPPTKASQGDALTEALSERELEVLHLIAAGWSNQEIADKLVISVRTVKKHVENIHAKLGVRSRTQAAVRARELNLL
jgi:LuxR family transcriptional regulator, maltose regulon positive regulatory protein